MDGATRRWSREVYELAEGPRWVGDRLLFVDILSGRLLSASPDEPGEEVAADLGPGLPLGAVAPLRADPDRLVAAVRDGVGLLDRSGRVDWLARPERAASTAMRVNDGSCDPYGRFWFTTMARDQAHGEGRGSLYRVDADGTLARVLRGLTIPNGPAFSLDGAMLYLAHSTRGEVVAHPLDAGVGLGEPRTLVRLSEGAPDGLAVDTAGCLWVAVHGTGRVHRYDPDGELVDVVAVPTSQPTAPCLVGSRLFVTTAYEGMAEPDDGAGAVYAGDVDATGVPALPFG